jgi:hypothetical protein
MTMMRQEKKETQRAHESCWVAIHKETGLFFGGKGTGTQTGYSHKRYLSSAMTEAKVNKDDYYIAPLVVDPHEGWLDTAEGYHYYKGMK